MTWWEYYQSYYNWMVKHSHPALAASNWNAVKFLERQGRL